MRFAGMFGQMLSILACVLPGGGEQGERQSDLGARGYEFSLIGEDRKGHRHSIQFGLHSRATYGFDAALGEVPIPPPPAVPAFDIRFLDPMRRKQWPGNGAYRDIRPLVSRTQVDTFYIGFQPADGSFPMVFLWPLGLAEHCDSAVIEVEGGDSTQAVDMLSRNTLSIADPSITSLRLITYGARVAGQGATPK